MLRSSGLAWATWCSPLLKGKLKERKEGKDGGGEGEGKGEEIVSLSESRTIKANIFLGGGTAGD